MNKAPNNNNNNKNNKQDANNTQNKLKKPNKNIPNPRSDSSTQFSDRKLDRGFSKIHK